MPPAAITRQIVRSDEQNLQILEWAKLIEKTADGDEAAFARLYDSTCELLFGLISRILNRSNAAETTLETIYLEIWRQAGAFDSERENAQVWLTAVARRIAIQSLRETCKNLQSTAFAETFDRNEDDKYLAFVAETTTNQMRQKARSALGALTPEQRTAIELAYFRGLNLTEIAAFLGQSDESVRKSIYQGMQSFRLLACGDCR